jgi:hypothetical protein
MVASTSPTSLDPRTARPSAPRAWKSRSLSRKNPRWITFRPTGRNVTMRSPSSAPAASHAIRLRPSA